MKELIGAYPVTIEIPILYKIPLTHPDKVTAGASVETVEDDRFIMKYGIISHNHGKIAASGDGLIVSFDYQNNEKAPLPDLIKSRIMELEKK